MDKIIILLPTGSPTETVKIGNRTLTVERADTIAKKDAKKTIRERMYKRLCERPYNYSYCIVDHTVQLKDNDKVLALTCKGHKESITDKELFY